MECVLVIALLGLCSAEGAAANSFMAVTSSTRGPTHAEGHPVSLQSESTEQNVTGPQAVDAVPTQNCTSSPDSMVSMVVGISPLCFDRCPNLCGALEPVVLAFASNPDPLAIEKQVCERTSNFVCAFQEENFADCQAVLSAGAAFNVPQTQAELSRRCAAVAGGKDLDIRTGRAAWRGARIMVSLLVCATFLFV